MWKPALTSVLLSLGMVGFVPEASAPETARPPAANLQEYLSLSDSQRQALAELQARMRTKARASVRQLGEKQRALRTQLASGDLNPFTVGKLYLSLEVAKDNAEATSAELRKEALALLSVEQLARLQKLEEARQMQPLVREAVGLFLIAPPTEVLTGTGPLGMFQAPPPRRGLLRKPQQPQTPAARDAQLPMLTTKTLPAPPLVAEHAE